MARISTYIEDTTINDHDSLIGTDGGTGQAGSSGATKNFTLSSLRNYFLGGDGISTGVVPIGSKDGLDESVIYQDPNTNTVNISGDVVFGGKVTVGGVLCNDNGQVFIPGVEPEFTFSYDAGIIEGDTATIFQTQAFKVYVVTGDRMIRLPSAPGDGAWIKFVNLSGSTGVTLLLPNGRIMNQDDMYLRLNDPTASFEMVYIDQMSSGESAPVGWVIVGAT